MRWYITYKLSYRDLAATFPNKDRQLHETVWATEAMMRSDAPGTTRVLLSHPQQTHHELSLQRLRMKSRSLRVPSSSA